MDIYKIYKIDTDTYHNLTIDNILQLIRSEPQKTYYKCIGEEKIKIHNDFVIKTQFICHRINTLKGLYQVPRCFGTEIDIRDDNSFNELILAHDPYQEGESFSEYLNHYAERKMEAPLILNIKSERIELECLELLEKYNITNYFFLDSSFPMIYLLNTQYKNNKIACRFSEFEPIESVNAMNDMISHVWVDCFTKQPLNTAIYNDLLMQNKKICIVSPELQKQEYKLLKYRDYFIAEGIVPDYICCKTHNIIHWI